MTEDLAAGSSGMSGQRAERAYGPSWLDVAADWVARQRVPAWAVCIALWIALLLPMEITKWSDGTLAFGTFHPIHIVLNGVTVFMLAVCPLLDRVAAQALEQARPALAMSDAEFEGWRHRLTVTPARPIVVAHAVAVLGIAGGLALFADPAAARLAAVDAASIPDLVATGANAVALSAFLYHTLHQLRQVRALYAGHVRIDLFQIGPLQAFSRLTGLTAAALIVANYTMLAAFLAVSPAIAFNPVPLAVTAVNSITAVAVFFWPLLDLRTRMAAEKRRLLNENADELRGTFIGRRRLVENDQIDQAAHLKDVVDILVAERAVLERLPTWPWYASTVRGLGTTLLLPLVLLFVQTMIERL